MSAPSHRDRPSGKNAKADIPALEWVVGGVGLAIVVAVISVLLYEAVAGDKSPPDVKLTAGAAVPLQHGYLVKVSAENVGGEPAARVSVTAELWDQSSLLEASETQFEHLPPQSTRKAGVFFQRDPRAKEIRLHARGYEVP